MGVSLDGYIVGPDGGFYWTEPDDEVFRFVTDEIRGVGGHLMGRRLYETMLYWETADQDPSLDDAMPAWPLAAWRRRSNGCEPSPGRATSRSAARLSPPRRPRWV
jgi:dihydrofolate reductase